MRFKSLEISGVSRGRGITQLVLLAIVTSVPLWSTDAFGATAAYWRHEEGPAGGLIPAGTDTVLDSSGNGNHMRTFDPVFTSADYTTSVSPLPLRSGLPNNFALNFGPGGVDEDRAVNGGVLGRDDDNYTEGKLIQTQLFTAMTVEVAFKMDVVGGYQAIVGRDGKPIGDMIPPEDNSPVPPFKILVRGDDFPDTVPNQIFVEFIDGDGTLNSDIHFLATRETVQPNVWYHVAFTLTTTDAQLWVAQGTGEYLLKDSKLGQDYVGPSGEVAVFDPAPWTVGRGAFGNGIADWVDATIDEVRVSDVALNPNQFLFLPPAGDADFDNSGFVDGKDYLIWQAAFGGPGGPTTGDATGDGQVNVADFNAWKLKFGGPPAVAAGQGVPEPCSWGLAILGLTAEALRRRRVR